MVKIDGNDVVLTTSFVMGLKNTEASVDFPEVGSRLLLKFDSTPAKPLGVQPSMGPDGILFIINDASQNFAYSYDGTLNQDGAPAFSLFIYVAPVGEGASRSRLVVLTVTRLAQ